MVSKEIKDSIIKYCKDKGYSLEALGNTVLFEFPDVLFVSREVTGDPQKGLLQDIDTMPIDVLIYNKKSGLIEETKATKKYLLV